ncbi:putative ferric-chelate reductase [Didymella exigua CBS 183.55]|uniref:ferric-chelate reductase (NADPH) n=1 Tax=Didymella exigua CBS 183.55 TaxID=1150837 RepID=A0A6A5R7C8_9PLEO|nr:putative ferric-chelate reductase [Didymella exigua CBS 183.55]KAF1922874.1 putative ferric-chelate reductase [Didymella exigua CBS 183.55]
MASWLTYPLQLTGGREFTCEKFTEEQCSYYMQRWHFWYIADYVYALPTVAFFMSTIGVFVIGHIISSQVLGYCATRGPRVWLQLIAVIRYLSYRGFHVKPLKWNTAPVGLLILGAIGAVYFFCMDLIPQPYYWSSEHFGHSPPLGTRSGWMALACMPFVFATASKTNWITLTTGVSHEKIQVFHRWSAYAFFLLALMHTFPFIVYHIRFHDMVSQVTMMNTLFYWTGIVALIFQAWLTFASHSMMRHMSYEFFKATHFLAVVVFVIVFFWHCDYTLTSWHYFVATAAIYVPCFVYPWVRTAFEYGFTQKAHIHIEGNGFIRLTIPSVNMRWKPGQHCFLRFTSFGLQAFSSHPFTICSLPTIRANETSELVFYIRHSHGLTKKLHAYAEKQPGTPVSVLIDGPYGGINIQRFNEADRLLVIAGGSGAGWILSFLELFCRQRSATTATEAVVEVKSTTDEEKHAGSFDLRRSLRIILSTRDVDSRTWFMETVAELFAKYSMLQRPDDIAIEVHLTGETEGTTGMTRSSGDDLVFSLSSDNIKIKTKSDHVSAPKTDFSGRPDLPLVVQKEGERAVAEGSALSVYVCGPITMQNSVRNAVARENLGIVKGAKSFGVYLHSEHFSWA